MPTEACTCCSIAQDLAQRGLLHEIDEQWTVNARIGHKRPGLVVQSRHHRESMADLIPTEVATLGRALAAASDALAREPGVVRVYVHLWNESTPGHVHWHLVPRMEDDDVLGPSLTDEVTASGSGVDPARAAVRAAGSRADQHRNPERRAEPSALVRGIRGVCRTWAARLSLYRAVQALSARRGGVLGLDPGEVYVLFWLMVAAIVLGLSAFAPVGIVGVGTLALVAYRWTDILLFEINFLLTMERSTLRSVPRALVLRCANLAEVGLTTASATMIVDGGGIGAGGVAGFLAVTLQPELSAPLTLAEVVSIGATLTAFVLLSGGIGLLVGKVSETFSEDPDPPAFGAVTRPRSRSVRARRGPS